MAASTFGSPPEPEPGRHLGVTRQKRGTSITPTNQQLTPGRFKISGDTKPGDKSWKDYTDFYFGGPGGPLTLETMQQRRAAIKAAPRLLSWRCRWWVRR
jgi:hypothetical protein